MPSNRKITHIGLAREVESLENPGALEQRVALLPDAIAALIKHGCTVYIEKDAGAGMGFCDANYEAVGATIQSSFEIYKNKDMVIKLKGPPMNKIKDMREGCILFCMAHFQSFPKRAELLKKFKINVIAMEQILEFPKFVCDELMLSKLFVETCLPDNKHILKRLHIGFLGCNTKLIGGIRRAGNKSTKSLTIYKNDVLESEIRHFGEFTVFFYDSEKFTNTGLLKKLAHRGCQLFDLKKFAESRGNEDVAKYRNTCKPSTFGGRRIQCLEETGVAGARYGFNLLKHESLKKLNSKNANIVILGYGNVGMGAILECYKQNARVISILTRSTTTPEVIPNYLKNADLIINAVEQEEELRGKHYLITNSHTLKVIKPGSVVIDLIGGSISNRSAVEDVEECTFLSNPYFEKNKVLFSALWGWPILGMLKESATKYSEQIIDVLLNREMLINGIEEISPGVKVALVCGPYESLSYLQ